MTWSTTGLSDLSSTAVDTITGEMSLSIRSSRSNELGELGEQNIHFLPLVWTADGRPHPAVTRTLQYAADIASSRNGQHLSAKSLHHRWKHEIQIALLRRRAAMARADQPNPVARAEWLFAGIIDRALHHWGHVPALTSCGISTPRLACRPAARFSHCSCWTSPTGDGLSPRAPTLTRGDVFALAAAAHIGIKLHSARYPDPAPLLQPGPRQPTRSLTDLLTALAASLGRRQSHNVPPLHTAQVVHEVVSEEYRTLVPLNCETTVFTPADWARLFETRFSLNVEHLRQRFPQGTGSWLSLLTRVPSEVLASTALLLARDFVRDRSLYRI